jgi:ABC-type amino acid transport substrate-binding protein
MYGSRQIFRNALTFVLIFGLLSAVNLLPPDTSLAQLKSSGVLRACIPTHYPPLVVRGSSLPGIDVEILQAVADDLGLRLALNVNSNMGRDFNPRNWRVTRAQCSVLAGGVIGSPTTRSFLETAPAHLQTGWALLAPGEVDGLDGKEIGFYAGISGLDRIALSRFLREQGARVTTLASSAELMAGLANGRFEAGVTEALAARQMAGDAGWSAQWLPEELGRFPVVLGLWKGDLTLKRAVAASLAGLERKGRIDAILGLYQIAPISECAACAAIP